MKKFIPLMIFIIFFILGIISNLFIDNNISIVLFTIASISITYYFYTRKETLKDITENSTKLLSFALTFILIAAASLYATSYLKNYVNTLKNRVKDYVAPVELVAIATYSEAETDLSLQTYTSAMDDTSLVIVKNNSDVIIRSSKFEKYNGTSTNCEYSNLYGLNALYLNKAGSHSLLTTSELISEEKCAIPLFATGEKSYVEVTDTRIMSRSSNNSSAIVATIGGEIRGNNITVVTKGKNSPAIKVLEDSKLEASNSLFETASFHSPTIYTEGEVSLENVTGTSNQDKTIYLKENGKVSIAACSFLSAGRGDTIDTHSAIDITGSKNELNIKDSSINISNKNLYYDVASIFYIHDAESSIDLENTTFLIGSDTFLKTKDSNIEMNLKDEKIEGDFIIDNSTLKMNLENSSLTGNIDNVILTLDEKSTITLTKDTYLKELHNQKEDNSNIDYNGYKLYVNNQEI